MILCYNYKSYLVKNLEQQSTNAITKYLILRLDYNEPK